MTTRPDAIGNNPHTAGETTRCARYFAPGDTFLTGTPDPDAGPHAIQTLLDRAVGALARRWDCPVRWRRGERIVAVTDNYDLLGYDPADVTREARYSRYAAPRLDAAQPRHRADTGRAPAPGHRIPRAHRGRR